MKDRHGKVGFTGTRRGMTTRQREELNAILPEGCWFHHGDCVGADAQAHEVARQKGCAIVIHPCTLTSQRAFCVGADRILTPKRPLVRNRDIVEAVDWLIAAPATLHEVLRSGTWATIRYARKIEKQVRILKP